MVVEGGGDGEVVGAEERRGEGGGGTVLVSSPIPQSPSLSYNMSHIIAAVGGAALAYGAKILYASAQKSSSSGTPILYYWPARGRGEQIRLIFAEAGVDFVDDTFDMTSAEAREAFFARCRTLGMNLTTNIPMVFSATSGIPTHTTPEKHPRLSCLPSCGHAFSVLGALSDASAKPTCDSRWSVPLTEPRRGQVPRTQVWALPD